MITAKTFIGSLLDQISLAQEMSDRASVAIAGNYLQGNILKGFPVPRMQINQLDLELNFSVPGRLAGSQFLDDPEVQKNVTYRLRQLLEELAGSPEFAGFIDSKGVFLDTWRRGLDDVANRLRAILANSDLGFDEVIARLTICIENFIYESAADEVKSKVGLALFGQPGKASPIATAIEPRIRDLVGTLRQESDGATSADPLDVCVLVGATDLDKVNAAAVNKMKVSLSPANRRWVVSQQNGQEVHTLERA